MSEFDQPKTEMDTKIQKVIVDETDKLNACVLKFLKDNEYEDEEEDFTPCCNAYEQKMLIDCYNIFFPNPTNVVVDVDMDFIKALIAYYYNLSVFEHYFSEFANEKYLRVTREVSAKDLNETNTKSIFGEKDLGFMVNDGHLYLYIYKQGDADKDNMYNVINELGSRYYIYKNWEEKEDSKLYRDRNENGVGINPVNTSFGFECLSNLVNTPRSKFIYKKLAFGNGDNLSTIRRTLLGFNTEQSVYEKEIAKVDNIKVDNVKVNNVKINTVKGKNLKGKEYYDYWEREISKIYWRLNIKPPDNIDLLLEKYKGKEQELIDKINAKYNPNYKPKPATTDVPPPLPSQDSKNYKEIITALYQKHNPEKLNDIPTLLEKYKGQEEEMIAKIKNKYEKNAATAAPPQQKGGYKSYKGGKKYMKKNTKKYVKKNMKKYTKKYIKKSRKK